MFVLFQSTPARFQSQQENARQEEGEANHKDCYVAAGQMDLSIIVLPSPRLAALSVDWFASLVVCALYLSK